ncbi:NYN domain-containing protein [Methylobacterium sp. JK268]
MARHIVIDNSNVYHTLTSAAARLEPNVPWFGIRMHLDNFFDLLENRSEVMTRALVGSQKNTAGAVWEKARSRGYHTYILKRILNDDNSTSEQGVDEFSHLIIANAILDYSGEQSLVIVSGDGRDSEFGTSFYSQARRALRHGWKVEIWAFSDGMTGRYNGLLAEYTGNIKKIYLDDYYDNITFVQTNNLRNPQASLPAELKRNAKPLVWPWL